MRPSLVLASASPRRALILELLSIPFDVRVPDSPETLLPGELPAVAAHRLAVENGQPGVRFYLNTKNEKVTTASRPYRADTFILISAGYDGEYGTPDDICNYEWKYRELQ